MDDTRPVTPERHQAITGFDLAAAQQIAASSRQQLTGMDQITRAMENINQAAIQTQSGMQQAELGTQKLNDLAGSLTVIVKQYKV